MAGSGPRRSRAAGTRRNLAAALTVVAVAAALLGGLAAVPPLMAGTPDAGTTALVALGLTLVAVTAAWIAFVTLDGHFDDLRRIEEDLSIAAAADRRSVRWRRADAGDELGAVVRAVDRAARRWAAGGAGRLDRVAEILGGLDAGVVVFTSNGLISVANPAATGRLGPERVRIGRSVFSLIDRDVLGRAMARAGDEPQRLGLADGTGRPCTARLVRLGDGGMLCMDAAEAASGPANLDLSLHDHAPPPVALADDLPLAALPALSLDIETTGLDPQIDRLLSLRAVRVDGFRMYEADALDLLVDPGMPIPERSIRVHGIDDAMVAGAPSLPTVWAELRRRAEGTVIVGHQIGFDMAVLDAEAVRHRLPRLEVPAVCTMRAYSLAFGEPSTGLDQVAARLGVDVLGRHTALGDAIVTGAVWQRLLPILAERGIDRWSQLRDAAAPPPWTVEGLAR